ncbi:MAG: RHS repeat-associated core domain-containing protein [Terracidiphilus sp.]
MGTWSLQYDALNRLAAASDNQSGTPNTNYCWSYDDFGNRTAQAGSNQPFTNAVGASTCQPASGATFNNAWAHYTVDGTLNTPNNGKNQLTATPAGNLSYDAAGDVTFDGAHQYLYDAEGRICASAPASAPGNPQLPATGYLYDVDGTRVAKGTITTWSCDPIAAGFQTTSDYILGPGGEQVTEMGMGGTTNGATTSGLTWQHTNVYAAGTLIATYDNDGLHFYLNDPLGTRRAQTDYTGVLEQTCASLPFGDGLNCSGGNLNAPTEHHFTGKERDTESGNDYFKYRYYASSMGRWLSPDPSLLTHADLENPQSLNLYNYVGNRPLTLTDLDGLCWKGFQWACDLGQAIRNYATGYGFQTDNGVALHPNKRSQKKIQSEREKSYRKETRFVPDPDDDRPQLTALVKGVAQQTGWIPDVCSGGTFTYAGKEVSSGGAHAFQGVIVEHDSESGTSSSLLTEVGGGEEAVGGGGVIQPISGGGANEAIAFGGVGGDVGAAEASGGAFLSPGSIGGYGEVGAGGRVVGGGAYVNVSTMANCARKR